MAKFCDFKDHTIYDGDINELVEKVKDELPGKGLTRNKILEQFAKKCEHLITEYLSSMQVR